MAESSHVIYPINVFCSLGTVCTVLGQKFESKERFRAKGALLYAIYLL
jgi:hypothetical protein